MNAAPSDGRLLFVSPVWPRLTGNGLAMRAAQVVRALSTRYRITLAVLSPARGADAGDAVLDGDIACESLPADVDTLYGLISRIRDERDRFAALAAYPRPVDSRWVSAAAADRVAELAAGVDVVHVMRLYLAPLIEPLTRWTTRPALVLDCDDDDAAFHRGLAARIDATTADEAQRFELAEARKYEAMQARWLPVFDRVFVASPADLDHWPQARAVGWLPNVVEAPLAHQLGAPQPGGRDADTLRLLFVANLTYAPNAVALQWLSEKLAPVLTTRWRGRVVIDVVGAGGPDAGALHPCLQLHGYVADLAAAYARCDAAVAPLLFGSGTPIKIIEAMAAGAPVVASSFAHARMGAEGGAALTIADSPELFADACSRLKQDQAHRARRVAQGRRLAAELYSPAALDRRLEDYMP